MPRFGLGARLALVGALLAAACRPGPPLVVEVAGCEELTNEGCACADGAELYLWVAAAAVEGLELRRDGLTEALPHPEQVQGGLRLRLPAQAGWWTLSARGRTEWRFQVTPAVSDAGLVEVRRLRRAGAFAEAEATLRELSHRPQPPIGWEAQAARNALAQGQVGVAVDAFRRSIAVAEASSRVLASARDRLALAHTLATRLAAWDEAAAVLSELEVAAARSAEVAADRAQTSLVLALERQDLRRALPLAKEALARAERLGLADLEEDSRQGLIGALVRAGRWAEVKGELDTLRARVAGGDACRRAQVLVNLGWYALLGHRRAPALFPEPPWAELQGAEWLFRSECPDPEAQANLRLNLGWAALYAGRLEEGQHWWTRAGTSTSANTQLRVDGQHLGSELAWATGDPDAGAAFSALLDAAQRSGRVELSLAAHDGLARVAVAQRRTADARVHFEAAALALGRLRALTALGQGQDSLLHDHRELWRRWVDLEVSAGQPSRAAAVIETQRQGAVQDAESELPISGERRSRLRRELLDRRAELDRALELAWRSPADERGLAEARVQEARRGLEAALDRLVAPASPPLIKAAGGNRIFLTEGQPDGVMIIAAGERWSVARWRRREGRRVEVLVGAEALAPGPIVLHAPPALVSLDWAAGWPERSVAFAGPGTVRPTPAPAPGPRRALVIGDPSATLPTGRSEAERVADELSKQGWRVELHTHPMTGADLSARLNAGPWALFHYAGHGQHAGLDGLQASLQMVDGPTFDVARVLGLEQAPRRVVLNACEVGSSGSDPEVGGLGLAAAFGLRGAEQVVASVDRIDEPTAQALVRALYLDGSPSNALLLPSARKAPEVSRSFRLFESPAPGGATSPLNAVETR